MALAITQKPLYDLLPTGEHINFTVYNNAVLTASNPKYIARLYISKTVAGLGTTGNLGAASLRSTLKANPNSAAVGMFDFSPIIDSFVSPDYEGGWVESTATGADTSNYEGVGYHVSPHSIHHIDRYCCNQKSAVFFRVIFNWEYLDASGIMQEHTTYVTSETYMAFNGVLDEDQILKEDNNNYGYNLNYDNYIMNDSDGKFLTSSPKTQYIGNNDFHTMAFFSNFASGNMPSDFDVGVVGQAVPAIRKIHFQFYYNGSTTGSVINMTCGVTNGGKHGVIGDTNSKLIYAGVGTANLQGWGQTIPANWDYYTVIAKSDGGDVLSDTYYFYNKADDCMGYERIRLAWLNKFGAWDYYNFTKKSKRTITKEFVQYQQQSGTWNEDKFRIHGYKGGARPYANKATEKIEINTDFITEEEGVWLEELLLSNDVFMLNEKSTDSTGQGYIRKYIEPVLLTSEEMIRKTKANDRLIQYTFFVTKSKNRKTHRK